MFFFIRGQIINLVRDDTIQHTAIRCFKETEFIDLGIQGHGRNQTDVRTFRGLNRADAPVMACMNVADFEACAVTAQTAGTESTETSLVGKFGQWIGLIHELGKLIPCKEIPDDADKSLRIDQLVRCNAGFVGIDQRHFLFDEALCPVKTDAAVVLKKLADGTDTSAAEMVDIVRLSGNVSEFHQSLGGFHQVRLVKNSFRQGKLKIQTLIQFETADSPEVISLVVEEKSLEKLFCIIDARRIAGTHSAVDFTQGIFRSLCRISCKTVHQIGVAVRYKSKINMLDLGVTEKFYQAFIKLHEFIDQERAICGINRFDGMERGNIFSLEKLSRSHGFDFISGRKHISVRLVADGTEESGDEEFSSSALTVKINIDKIIDIKLNLHPGPPVGNDPV